MIKFFCVILKGHTPEAQRIAALLRDELEKLKGILQRGAVRGVVDNFKDILSPIKQLAKAAKAAPGWFYFNIIISMKYNCFLLIMDNIKVVFKHNYFDNFMILLIFTLQMHQIVSKSLRKKLELLSITQVKWWTVLSKQPSMGNTLQNNLLITSTLQPKRLELYNYSIMLSSG